MVTVTPGSAAALVSTWQEYPGGPAADLTGATITITALAGGAPAVGPTSTGVTHPAAGVYVYTWAVPAGQAAGDYLVVWAGVDAQGDAVTASEIVSVAGSDGGSYAPVRLSTTVRDTSGAPADPASVSLLVLLPDGVVAGPYTPAKDGTGLYHYDFTPVQAGHHVARWVTAGPVGDDEQPFEVAPIWGEAGFISLADAKKHSRKTSTEDDEHLQVVVVAACKAIVDRMGHVSPVTVTHTVTRYGDTIVLPERPVIAVTSVQRLPGLQALPPVDEAAGTPGWYLDGSEGVLRHTTSFGGRVRVTYRAGRTPLPPNFRLAALELVAHLWRGSQHNQGGGRPALGETDSIAASVRPFALPYRVMELLGLKKDQERDEPLIG